MKYPSFIAALIALAGLSAAFAQSPALTYIPNSSVKLYQVNGDCDWAEWDATITNKTPTCNPTISQTLTKADILGDDVPVVFENNGEMIVTFGDTIGAPDTAPGATCRILFNGKPTIPSREAPPPTRRMACFSIFS